MNHLFAVKFILIFILFIACGCSGKDQVKLIPEKKMVEIMIDVFLFESQLDVKNLSGDSLIGAVKNNYQMIAARHSVEEQQFFKTFEFYEEHPEKMDGLMTKVIDEMSKMEADLKAEDEPEGKF